MHPITAVCNYATRGWPAFPCDPQKRPRTARGFKDATTDTDWLRTHWTDHPDDLIGIATGNGLVVVDVDSYKGEAAEWEAFCSENGGLPATFTVRTGRGGTHYYFRSFEPIRSTTGLFPAVDVRAEGGYVIAAPGRSVYGEYVVQDESSPALAPEWLLARLRERRAAPVASGGVVVRREDLTPEEVTRCEHYAAQVMDLEVGRLRECSRLAVRRWGSETYSGPEWNRTTYEVACNLLEIVNSTWNSLTEDDAYRAVMTHAPRDSGFGEADVLERWNSARKTIGDKGRSMPAPVGGGLYIPFSGGDRPSVDPGSFFVKGEGLDVTRLAAAVMELGPLAVDTTPNRGVWKYRNGVWLESPHEVSDRCAVLLGGRFRVNHVTTVTPVIQQALSARGAAVTCEPVPEFVNVRNGMLHWKTGVLYPHDPGHYSTVQLPVEWDPEARCPQFDKFAVDVMAPDAIDYMWEMIGYLVMSGNPFQRAFLFHGSGINGKGTLIRVLTGLLGAENVSAVTLTDLAEARFEVASLYGKTANLAGDIDATYMKSTARFKAITGEDQIRAEKKYQHGFSFQCWAVPVFSANEFWKSSDTTTGYRRRWQLLPFPNTFTISGGQGLTARLVSETPGILVKAISALQRLMDRGDFDTPKSAQEEKQRFELAADQVAEWLQTDPCVVTAEPTTRHISYPRADAYRAYRRWTEENGNAALPSSKWWQRMAALGYVERKSGVLMVCGLAVQSRQIMQPWPVPAGVN